MIFSTFWQGSFFFFAFLYTSCDWKVYYYYYYCIYYFTLYEFFTPAFGGGISLDYYFACGQFAHQRQPAVYHWNLCDSKSPLFSRSILLILANLNNDGVRIASFLPLISCSFSSLYKSLGTVSSAPTSFDSTTHSNFSDFPSFELLSSICLYQLEYSDYYIHRCTGHMMQWKKCWLECAFDWNHPEVPGSIPPPDKITKNTYSDLKFVPGHG